MVIFFGATSSAQVCVIYKHTTTVHKYGELVYILSVSGFRTPQISNC